MLVSISWIRDNYAKFNNLYWGGKLPNIEFKINRQRCAWGRAGYRINRTANTCTPLYISMSNYMDSPEDIKINTLLHEMIHIADYTFNPHHFVMNGRAVKSYDSHGSWFLSECHRLEKYGYSISTKVRGWEMANSEYSEHTKVLNSVKTNKALIVGVEGNNNKMFYVKTSRDYIGKVINDAKNYRWERLSGVRKIRVFTITDTNISTRRSSTNLHRGWLETLTTFESVTTKRLGLSEVNDYDNISEFVINKMVA